MLVRDELVVKLPAARVTELVESGAATWFDAGKGRPMREWASIPATSTAEWTELVAEAFVIGGEGRGFVGGGRS